MNKLVFTYEDDASTHLTGLLLRWIAFLWSKHLAKCLIPSEKCKPAVFVRVIIKILHTQHSLWLAIPYKMEQFCKCWEGGCNGRNWQMRTTGRVSSWRQEGEAGGSEALRQAEGDASWEGYGLRAEADLLGHGCPTRKQLLRTSNKAMESNTFEWEVYCHLALESLCKSATDELYTLMGLLSIFSCSAQDNGWIASFH